MLKIIVFLISILLISCNHHSSKNKELNDKLNEINLHIDSITHYYKMIIIDYENFGIDSAKNLHLSNIQKHRNKYAYSLEELNDLAEKHRLNQEEFDLIINKFDLDEAMKKLIIIDSLSNL